MSGSPALRSDLPVVGADLSAGVRGLFTTRGGGVSAAPWDGLNLARHVGDDPESVAANRARLAAYLGGPSLVFLDQVHGAEVAVIDTLDQVLAGRPSAADGVVTRQRDVALIVQVADCLPVLFADPSAAVIGAAHAGRRGLAAGVLTATLEAMESLGADRSRIEATIGPAICGRCYEVPAGLRDEVAGVVPGSRSTTRSGTPALDLPAGAEATLRGLGLGRVQHTGICALEDERFFSYRRNGVTGRFAGAVMLDHCD